MSQVEVLSGDLLQHPKCPHGPTLLFSRLINGEKRRFFACSACRDRKLCPFFMYEEDVKKLDKTAKEGTWGEEIKKYTRNKNHRKLFLTLNKVQTQPEPQRVFCSTCAKFELGDNVEKHIEHNLVRGVRDVDLEYPSEFLTPLEDAKKEAQFMFSKSSVQTLAQILKHFEYKNIICVGTPRIFEHLRNTPDLDMNPLLLDFDSRYLNFWGPLEFCWYNCFNHHFFLPGGKDVFEDFLTSGKAALIMDPPFGGRVEPLAHTLNTIRDLYKKRCGTDLPIFWAFPYFMEAQILNSLPDFQMLDYKVDYENHPLFRKGPKGRKLGSPVRIFTNVSLKSIKLPSEDGYKYCKLCEKYVSEENQHCLKCKSCTSKDGRTYVHCDECKRCVKPTWKHCNTCGRCALPDHSCEALVFSQECFHCKQPGHKKRDCPNVDQLELHKKRKLKAGFGTEKGKKRKVRK